MTSKQNATINYLDGSPRRRCVLSIQIQADNRERVIDMLRWLLMDIEEHGPRESISGGYDASHSMSYSEDETITHDTFAKALKDHLQDIRSKKADTNHD